MIAVARGQVAMSDLVYAPNPKPPADGPIGTNYTPAYSVNQVQFWPELLYATGQSEALFFEDFENHSDQAWTPYGRQDLVVRNAGTLKPDMKAIAGDETWADYIVEGEARAPY